MSDMGWEPIVTCCYNAQRVLNAHISNVSYLDYNLSATSKADESVIMHSIQKFCFCDLSNLVNTLHKLSEDDRNQSNYYKILNFSHGLQSEKFTFVITKAGGTRIYGHCRRCFTYNKSNNSQQMPTALCLISSHAFHKLFDQIMDHCLTRWFISGGTAIFPLLDGIILQPTPALGDTFTINIKSQINKIPNEKITLKLESTYHQSLLLLFRTLSIDNITFLISCILTERRLIFYSNSLQVLSECIHSLLALIYPFRWQNIFVPILPESLLNYLCAPLPFIIGIKGYLALCMTDYPISEVIVVDLDAELNNNIRSCIDLHLLTYLPTNPSWKVVRQLKKIVKKGQMFLDTHDTFKSIFNNNKKQSRNSSNTRSILTNAIKATSKMTMNKLLETNNSLIQTAIQGWNDNAIYDTWLAFFVIFIGDWKKFLNVSNPSMPQPPFHLGTDPDNENEMTERHSRKNSDSFSVTFTTTENSGSNVSLSTNNQSSESDMIVSSPTVNLSMQQKRFMKFAGKAISDVKKISKQAAVNVKKKVKTSVKKRETRKQAQMFYDEQALKYIELLCQSQLFVSWFRRQQREANDPLLKVPGIQDRFDYALKQRYVNIGGYGASYTGCYKFLSNDSKYRHSMSHLSGNLRSTIDTITAFTSNREYSQLANNKKMVEKNINQLCIFVNRPLAFHVINNVLCYRLKDTLNTNFAHGLMSLFLLFNMIEKGSDRMVIQCCNKYAFYANVLQYRYIHETAVIANQMREIAGKLYESSTQITHLRQLRVKKYVAFGDLYHYKYDEYITDDDDLEIEISKSCSIELMEKAKSASLMSPSNSKTIQAIDFPQFNEMDINQKSQMLQVLGVVHDGSQVNDVGMDFLMNSQFNAANTNLYREQMMKGEVRMIPPFFHLHIEFEPDIENIAQYVHSNINLGDELLLDFLDIDYNDNKSEHIFHLNHFIQNSDDIHISLTKQGSILDMPKVPMSPMECKTNDEHENSSQSVPDLENAFLTRSSTNKDRESIRDFGVDWITFDGANTAAVDGGQTPVANVDDKQNDNDAGLHLFDSVFADKIDVKQKRKRSASGIKNRMVNGLFKRLSKTKLIINSFVDDVDHEPEVYSNPFQIRNPKISWHSKTDEQKDTFDSNFTLFCFISFCIIFIFYISL